MPAPNNPKRYDLGMMEENCPKSGVINRWPLMCFNPDGKYVLYSDYASMNEENEALKRTLRMDGKIIMVDINDKAKSEIKRLQSEVKRLASEVNMLTGRIAILKGGLGVPYGYNKEGHTE